MRATAAMKNCFFIWYHYFVLQRTKVLLGADEMEGSLGYWDEVVGDSVGLLPPDFEQACGQQCCTLLMLRKSIGDFESIWNNLFLRRAGHFAEEPCLICLSRNPIWYECIRVNSSLQIRCSCIVSGTWVRILWVGKNGGAATVGAFRIGYKRIPCQ